VFPLRAHGQQWHLLPGHLCGGLRLLIPICPDRSGLLGVWSFMAFPLREAKRLKNCFRVLPTRRRGAVTHPSSLLIAMALLGLMVVEIATRLHATA